MKKFLLIIVLHIVTSFYKELNAACQQGQLQLNLTIQADAYPAEIRWTIRDQFNQIVVSENFTDSANALNNYEYCLPAAGCYTFTITDDYGDGICCGFGNGYYTLQLNGSTIAAGGNYGSGENTTFNCPPGLSCNSSLNATVATTYSAGDNTWYTFTPSQNGIYQISTCGYNGQCNAGAIWVYNQCEGIVITEGIQGAIYYSASGCNGGALVNASLVANQDYFIRIGDGSGNVCGSNLINWQINYQGPITGCTDINACNFNPMASADDGSCIYPPNAQCDGPDLKIDSAALISSFTLTSYQAGANDCAVTENCVTGYGNRQVITFEMHIRNIGNQDYFIGSPPSNINTISPVFEWAPCHGHWHFQHYGKYTLYDLNGNIIPVGLKNGFCVMDLECDGGGTFTYGCGNMGISAGCGDIYGTGTTCQWIDITDVDTGVYVFQADINWLQSPDALGRYEQRYDNNVVKVCFRLNRNAAGVPSTEILGDCMPWTDCTGQLLGSAQTDCNGDCNGTALQGDVAINQLQEMTDVISYVSNVQTESITATPCTDLNEDETINIVDAALLQQCVIHRNQSGYWGAQIPCQFPYGRHNPNQLAVLTIADHGPNYIDVHMNSPLSKIMAFEFSLGGIIAIDSVKSLVPGFSPVIRFSNNRIAGIDTTEGVTPKFLLPAPFVRVFFTSNIPAEVCISQIHALVNENYETIEKEIAGDCAEITSGVSISEYYFSRKLRAVPNPFNQSTEVYVASDVLKDATIQLLDIAGRRINVSYEVLPNKIVVNDATLRNGIYTLTIRSKNTFYYVRLVKSE